MVEPPADKRPVGTVPKTTDEEYNQCVADDLPTGTAATAKGEVDVIAEPRHE